jgi:hypothetical protein
MAEFSGKVVSAEFIDAEYTLIKVRYEENGVLNVYQLFANPDHPDYQALLEEGWDADKIVEETAASKRAQSAAWNTEVNNAAKILLKEKFGYDQEGEDSENKLFSWEYFFEVMNNNTDKIFEFKIWGFESEKMKNATEETKTNFRKAKTFVEAIKIYETVL